MKHPKSARHLSRLLAWHVERRARQCTILQGCGRSGKSFLVSLWGIAQLVRTPACHAGGRSDLNPFGCQKVNDWIYFRHADLPVLNAQDSYFVIGLAAYRRNSSSRGRKAIIARSTDGKIQTIQKEDPMTQTTGTQRSSEQADAIRTFQKVNFPEAELAELRRRINATIWPERETVTDTSQGVQLATTQALAHYWGTDYDWRKCEAKLNALPQFITEIDGLDIHFIHVRSKHENALPLIVTHGWPGSVIEQMKIIDPLTNPTAHGGNASDAFDIVVPSMPGYGFSGRPTTTGWDPAHIARAWTVLMKRLGYKKFVAQGGDWGAPVSNEMAKLGAPELLGIHVNLPGVVPLGIFKAVASGDPEPTNLSEDERHAFAQ